MVWRLSGQGGERREPTTYTGSVKGAEKGGDRETQSQPQTQASPARGCWGPRVCGGHPEQTSCCWDSRLNRRLTGEGAGRLDSAGHPGTSWGSGPRGHRAGAEWPGVGFGQRACLSTRPPRRQEGPLPSAQKGKRRPGRTACWMEVGSQGAGSRSQVPSSGGQFSRPGSWELTPEACTWRHLSYRTQAWPGVGLGAKERPGPGTKLPPPGFRRHKGQRSSHHASS